MDLYREIKLEIPNELEIGQTYTLVVKSVEFSLSACLVKEEKSKVEGSNDEMNPEFRRRLRNMGVALAREGVQNLNLVLNGGGGVINSSSTSADIFAHGIQGVIRAGQE